MEKKVTTSPVGKPSSKGATIAPASKPSSKGIAAFQLGKASKGATGKKSTGTIPAPPSKTPTAPIGTPKPSTHHVHKHEMKHWCHEHMHRYVLAHTHDGWCCDGFIEHIDDEVVCLAVPHCGGMDRAFFPGPFFPPLYPYPFFPRRRFYRQVFPLAALVGLSLLPYY